LRAAKEQPVEITCDVLIVGGGPAGSTAAALLAKRGYSVVLAEKDKHPRFHIGESLLPMNLPLLEKLGVKDDVERIGVFKPGAQFVSSTDGRSSFFQFEKAMDKTFGYAYQVKRAEFDFILLKNAAAAGAKIMEQCRVTSVDFPEGGGIVAKGQVTHGSEAIWRAKFLVDASGRDTLLAKQFGIKRRNRDHNTAALYSHFANAKRLEGDKEGFITVFFFDHGWFWFIPLTNGTTSVGAVCHPSYLRTRKGDLSNFFQQTIALSPQLSERLRTAEMIMTPIGTGNYVYRADRMGGDRYIMLGDAFSFVDPMFSTGVYMAMTSAFIGADVIETCLREPQKAAQAMRKFEITMRRGVDTFCWFIYRITTPALRDLFLGPKNYFHMEEAVLALLAGDVFRRTRIGTPLFLFKLIYYVNSFANWRQSLMAWRMRRYAAQNASGGME
jgi:flavin-dependent dehydrogenase